MSVENVEDGSEAPLLEITFFSLFLSPDFHDNWHCRMSTCLFTEVN